MAKPISNEIREKIVVHKQNGATDEMISNWFIISKRSVSRIYARFRKTGSVEALPKNSGRKSAVSEEKMQKVLSEIAINPDMTLSKLCEKFELNISTAALCKKLKKLGYTFKKRHFMQPNKSALMSKKNANYGQKNSRR